jgi:hypothetical protein
VFVLKERLPYTLQDEFVDYTGVKGINFGLHFLPLDINGLYFIQEGAVYE